jgi:putative transcriptional regulator
MAKVYKSEAMAAVHEMMEGFHQTGAIDKQTMREFDEVCLTPAAMLSPSEIKAIREQEAVSQPVFARYLNVSKNLVSEWERGAKRPGGPALRLLTVVKKNGLRAIA